MNLYELAHHPDAFLNIAAGNNPFCFNKCSTMEQFHLLNATGNDNYPVNYPKYDDDDFGHDEMEYRMHLLFVHWATATTKEIES